MSQIIQVVKDWLDLRNLPPNVIEKSPLLVKKAVLDLQTNSKILPPKILEFKALDRKEEKRDTSNEVFFHYFYLPEDFTELTELFVFNETDTDNGQSVPYSKVPYEVYLNSLKTGNTRKYFAITDILEPNGNYRKIIALNPYPADDIMVRVKYFVDGSVDSLDFLKERHWNVIIKHIEGQLGIRSEEDARSSADEESSNWRNQSGVSPMNNTPRHTRGTFFSNTSANRSSRNRLR